MADNIIPGGVIILQYADDTIMCLKDNMDMARNLKLLLYLYEMMSGLKINFNKSEVLLIHGDMKKCLFLCKYLQLSSWVFSFTISWCSCQSWENTCQRLG